MTARVLVIANPVAARTEAIAVDQIRAAFRSAGWNVEVLATGGHGDARRLAEYGVSSGSDVVAVFGGDGTTMQAASALVNTDVALGVIPGGTGNLLAGNLRIPTAPRRAVETLVRGARRRLDLGRVQREDGEHYFAVACGAGYDALVMAQTAAADKRRWGMLAYTATTIRLLPRLKSHPFRITVDGKVHEVPAAMVLVANCGEVIPPFVKLGHGIRPDDGMLDVVAVRADTLVESVRAVWQILRSRWIEPGDRLFVSYLRGSEVRVEAAMPEPVELDGDVAGVTPVTATIVPGVLTVIAPSP